jgi:hypothetical protein
MSDRKFRQDNTRGYTDAELEHLSDLYDAEVMARGLSPDARDAREFVAERILREYDRNSAARANAKASE